VKLIINLFQNYNMETCQHSPWCEPGERCQCDNYQEAVRSARKERYISNLVRFLKYFGLGLLIFAGVLVMSYHTNRQERAIDYLQENCTIVVYEGIPQYDCPETNN